MDHEGPYGRPAPVTVISRENWVRASRGQLTIGDLRALVAETQHLDPNEAVQYETKKSTFTTTEYLSGLGAGREIRMERR